MEVIEL
jgi:hypothetical protein